MEMEREDVDKYVDKNEKNLYLNLILIIIEKFALF